MAIIDYTDIHSLRYAKLTLPAKALIPVLATISDKTTGLVPSEHSKLNYIAALTGMSYNATREGLQLLHDTKRIDFSIVQGHPPRIIYLPTAQFSSKAGSPPEGELALHQEENQESLNLTVKPLYDYSKEERQLPCSLNTPDLNIKTTTALTLSKKLVKEMIAKHGDSVVVSIISGMEEIQKSDPDAISSPGAYFRACCKKGWVPTTKNSQEKKLLQESREKARAAQDAADLEQEKRRQMIKAERNDPEVMKRIKAVQLSFTGMSTPSHSDHDAASSHAILQSEF